MRKFKCRTCGWVYDPDKGDPKHGIPAGTNFNELPDDWRCPVCGATKDKFIGQSV